MFQADADYLARAFVSVRHIVSVVGVRLFFLISIVFVFDTIHVVVFRLGKVYLVASGSLRTGIFNSCNRHGNGRNRIG